MEEEDDIYQKLTLFATVNPQFGIIFKAVESKKNVLKSEKIRILLTYISREILVVPYYLKSVLHYFPQYVPKLLSLALTFNDEAPFTQSRHLLNCILLSYVARFRKDMSGFALKYFNKYPYPFQMQEKSQEKHRKVSLVANLSLTDLDIVESTYFLLKNDPDFYRHRWKWTDFIKRFFGHKEDKVYWLSCQTIAIVLGYNEAELHKLILQRVSKEQHIKLTYQFNKNAGFLSQNLATPAIDQHPILPCSKLDQRDLVCVSGIFIPCVSSTRSDLLIEVPSTYNNLRKIAIGLFSNKALCLQGPVGCGKTSLVDHLAAKTGRKLGENFIKLQLGDQTDSKTLLGTYKCTNVPGEFVWQPGILTQAVTEGNWLLLEDIDQANMDIASVLTNLLENNALTVPGYRDMVSVTPGFQLFVTQRMVTTHTGHHKKHSNAIGILEKHLLQVTIDPLTNDELKQILNTIHPQFGTIVDRLIKVFNLFQNKTEENQSLVFQKGRQMSTRDFFKWCSRAAMNFDVKSQACALKVLQDAIDVFCCSFAKNEDALELAKQISTYLGIINQKAEYFFKNYKPTIQLNEDSLVAERSVLKREHSLFEKRVKFCFTRPASVLLERIMCCVQLQEPVLLVGETGTGKTSSVQYLAHALGKHLVVINMNQQSDSTDLLGGFKPVDQKLVVSPVRKQFEELFCEFFKIEPNQKYLSNIAYCFNNQRYSDLVKLMLKSTDAALVRLTKEISEKQGTNLTKNEKILKAECFLQKWKDMKEKLTVLDNQLKNKNGLAFTFVEGSLVKAIRNGYWVLLDEINLANAETLDCLSGLLEDNNSSLCLVERGDKKPIDRHPNFTLFACMNPSTDVGKKDLPAGLRNRFTEFFVDELTTRSDLIMLVQNYLDLMSLKEKEVSNIVDFYLKIRTEVLNTLSDGLGHKPHFSLRSLCRALMITARNPCGTFRRSLFEAFSMSFLTQLDSKSYGIVESLIYKYLVGEKTSNKALLKQQIPKPEEKGEEFFQFEGYWVKKGGQEPSTPKDYILTESVKKNLRDLVRVVSIGKLPVLLQGDTSVGKTSLITFLAQSSGNKCVRINNHAHTDLQEYVGSYVADENGKLVFREGILVEAMRKGHWIILDELNLAPSDVLEALNRVLDDNRELFIPETQETVKANPNFMLFATQNPPGAYAGRKMLSRAFRNRFVELHFNEIPPTELEVILQKRCQMAQSYAKKMISVMTDLQTRRRGSAAFAGKQGFITLRDLFRWGERYRLANITDRLYDWDQHMADEGYLILAGKVRKEEEKKEIVAVLQKHWKREVVLDNLFTLHAKTSSVTKHILQKIANNSARYPNIVWTFNMRKLAVLIQKAMEFKEPVLLVGETGGGKTTVCQLISDMNGQDLVTVNCHMHTESSDFIGGLRPVRDHSENNKSLFEWVDGPLLTAMRLGSVFLSDEISLADDSVLERLNSLLEPERSLLLAEKGIDLNNQNNSELLVAHENFFFIGTMNPGGDFGKKELSPALRNRFTEIWCDSHTERKDMIAIVEKNLQSQDGNCIGIKIMDFIDWFINTAIGKRFTVSIRDILTWVKFINVCKNLDVSESYFHGCSLVFLDSLGSGVTSAESPSILEAFKSDCYKFLSSQFASDKIKISSTSGQKIIQTPSYFGLDAFLIPIGTEKMDQTNFSLQAPTTMLNMLIVLRGMQLNKPILLEGSPGVGKTSLITALAKFSQHKIFRVNLSDQTDISDLFGADLPVEGGAGQFSWRDGPLLQALKEGSWILLDELNLASQSVLEGLNACLDHRGEIFIPELGKTFYVKPGTRFFGCQNPMKQGGSRRGLPKSFLNRFIQVYVNSLTPSDMHVILKSEFPKIPEELITQMVKFSYKLNEELNKKTFGYKGAPWECNLRDLTRWCQTILYQYESSKYLEKTLSLDSTMELIFGDRMRDQKDRQHIKEIFEYTTNQKMQENRIVAYVNHEQVLFGDVALERAQSGLNDNILKKDKSSLVLRRQLGVLRTLSYCVNLNWMAILVGGSGSGKSSVVKTLAKLAGKTLRTFPVTSAMDTTDILGGFEQTDYSRHLLEIAKKAEQNTLLIVQKLMLEEEFNKAIQLLEFWEEYLSLSDTKTSSTKEEINLFLRKTTKLEALLKELHLKCPDPYNKADLSSLIDQCGKIYAGVRRDQSISSGGRFEWVNSILIKCLQEGSWLIIDNVNLCNPAVLDRLNALLEPNGILTVCERGVDQNGQVFEVKPHKDFRLFLTMDPKNGEISRAMRNRGLEIYVENFTQIEKDNNFDFKSLVNLEGLSDSTHIEYLLRIHNFISSLILSEKPNAIEILQCSNLIAQQLQHGIGLEEAFASAFIEVYFKKRNMSEFNSNNVVEVIREEIKRFLNTENQENVDLHFNQDVTLNTEDLVRWSSFEKVKHQVAFLETISKNLKDEKLQIRKPDKNLLNQNCLIWTDLEKVKKLLQAFESSGFYYNANLIANIFSISSNQDLPYKIYLVKDAVKSTEWIHFIERNIEICTRFNRKSMDFPIDYQWIENSPRESNDVTIAGIVNIALQTEIQLLNDNFKSKSAGKNTLYNYVLMRAKNSVPDIFRNTILNNYLQLYDEFYTHLRKITPNLVELNAEQVVEFIFCLRWFQALHTFLASVEVPQSGFENQMGIKSKMNSLVLHYKWLYKFTLQNVVVNHQEFSKKLKNILKSTNEAMDKQFSIMYRVNKNYKQHDNVPEQFKTKDQVDASELVDMYNINDKSTETLAFLKNNTATRNNLIQLKSDLYDSNLEISDKIDFIKTNDKSKSKLSVEEEKILPFIDFYAKKCMLASLETIESKGKEANLQSILSNLLVSVDFNGLILRSTELDDKNVLHELRKIYFICSMTSYSTNPDTYLNPAKENHKNLPISGLNPILSYSLYNLLISEDKSDVATLKSFNDTMQQQKSLATILWSNLGLIGNQKYDFMTLQNSFVKSLTLKFIDTLEKSMNTKFFDSQHSTLKLDEIKGRLPKSLLAKITEIVDTYNSLHKDEDLQHFNFVTAGTKIADLHLLLGYTQASINSYLPQVDPLAKKAMKNVHITSILNMFKQMQKSIETQNLLFSNDKSTVHPYHAAVGKMIKNLEDKLEKYTKFVTSGPKSVVYELVVQQVYGSFETVIQETIIQDSKDINVLLENIKNDPLKRETLFEKTAFYIRRIKAIIPSFDRIILDWKTYKYSYPEIIEPLLSNISQLLYGLKMKLVLLKHCSMKYFYLEHHQKDLEAEIQDLVGFPTMPDLKTEVVPYTSVDSVKILTNAANGLVTTNLIQKESVRLLKCGLQELFNQCVVDAKLNGSLNKDLLDKFKELVAIFVDLYSQQQEKQEQMEREKETLYKTRTKCEEKSEEDQIKEDFDKLFAIQETSDFDDIQRDPTIDFPEKTAPTTENTDFIIISSEDLRIVTSLHSILFTTFTKSDWLVPQWHKNVNTNYVDPLMEKSRLLKNIVNKHVENLTYNIDDKIVGSLTVLLGAVRQLNGGEECEAILNSAAWKKEGTDFYKDSNVTEVKNCYPVLENLRQTINKYLEEWPGQPTLTMIITIIDRIQHFSITSPISRFLAGFEILLTRCYEWEQVAHSGISISDFCAELVNQIISWRKMELSKWKELLGTTFDRLNEPLKKWWVYIYNIMQQYTLENKYSADELTTTLKNFISTSNLAEFQGRVELLFEFHCHAVTLPKNEQTDLFLNILWNLYHYFKQFSFQVSNKLKELRGPIEKKVKDYLKIVKWKDVSYWTVKETILSTQKVLHKFVREYKVNIMTQYRVI